MPVVNVRVMENVLTPDQKSEIAKQMTETCASVIGEPARELTWVIVDDIASGALSIGGNQITTQAIQEMLAGAPVGV